MKKYYVLSLPLALALTLPAVAQQNSSGSNDQQQQSQDQAQPAANAQAQPSDQQAAATGKEPLKYERHEGFWGHLNPFARKKYVSRQLDPIRGRVNELDELTAKNSKMIADVDTRATEGIRQAMNKANEADSHAVDAGTRANQAQQTAQQVTDKIGGVEQTVSKLDQYQPVTEAEIHFRPGQAVLSQKAKDALDEMAATLKDQKGYILEVQGFSTGRGNTAIENSRKMAQSVVRYLVLNHDVPVYRIYTVGMGNAPVAAQGGAEGKTAGSTRGGRVEVSLLKNSLGTMANSSAPATTAAPNDQAPQQNTGGTSDKPSPTKPPSR